MMHNELSTTNTRIFLINSHLFQLLIHLITLLRVLPNDSHINTYYLLLHSSRQVFQSNNFDISTLISNNIKRCLTCLTNPDYEINQAKYVIIEVLLGSNSSETWHWVECDFLYDKKSFYA